jgi:hypothetical protein
LSGNDESDEDLVMGRTNRAQDPTRLIADSSEHDWGSDVGDAGGPVVYVSTGGVAPVAIEADGRVPGYPFVDQSAIRALGQTVAIHAECTAANGRAVEAIAANGAGVFGSGDPGIQGEAASEDGAGVLGTSTKGDGVIGASESGRGGSFSSRDAAQLHLTPLFGKNRLPCIGELGDMLMFSPLDGPDDIDPEGQRRPSLWLCIKSSVGDNAEGGTAVWARFQFDITYTCQGGAPPPPPELPSRGEG